jgi:hypothetical protein
MNPNSLSLWNQVQLLLLRLLSLFLGLVDSLFHVRWGARLLERLADRYQAQLVELDEALVCLEQERRQMQVQAEALAIQAAAIYLSGRCLTHKELRFDPADPHDEEMLDATIDLLVKERLATVEAREIGLERYVYYLEPDWTAICQRLAAAADQAPPESAAWFRDGIQFIDEASGSCSPAASH